jgi:hypothetical protein
MNNKAFTRNSAAKVDFFGVDSFEFTKLNTERPEKKMELIFKLRFYNIFS